MTASLLVHTTETASTNGHMNVFDPRSVERFLNGLGRSKARVAVAEFVLEQKPGYAFDALKVAKATGQTIGAVSRILHEFARMDKITSEKDDKSDAWLFRAHAPVMTQLFKPPTPPAEDHVNTTPHPKPAPQPETSTASPTTAIGEFMATKKPGQEWTLSDVSDAYPRLNRGSLAALLSKLAHSGTILSRVSVGGRNGARQAHYSLPLDSTPAPPVKKQIGKYPPSGAAKAVDDFLATLKPGEEFFFSDVRDAVPGMKEAALQSAIKVRARNGLLEMRPGSHPEGGRRSVYWKPETGQPETQKETTPVPEEKTKHAQSIVEALKANPGQWMCVASSFEALEAITHKLPDGEVRIYMRVGQDE